MRKDKIKKNDLAYNHDIMEGNIFKPETYHKLKKVMGKEKADLIISRMMGPSATIPKHPDVRAWLAKKLYNMLEDNGLMFLQFDFFDQHTPGPVHKFFAKTHPDPLRDTEKDVIKWAEFIQEKYQGAIEIQIDRGILRLHKKPGAPAIL